MKRRSAKYINSLKERKEMISRKLKELDLFFDDFLERYDDKLNKNPQTSEYWKTYNRKYKVYEEVYQMKLSVDAELKEYV